MTSSESVSTTEKFWEAVDSVLDRFEEGWRTGRRPSLTNFLPAPGHPLCAEILLELVKLDLGWRLRSGDRAPLVGDYFERRDLALGRNERLGLIRLEYERRWRQGERGVFRNDYCARFPEFAEELKSLVPLWDCPICKKENNQLEDETATTVTCRRCQKKLNTFEVFRAPEALNLKNPTPPRASADPSWPRLEGYEILGELGRGGMGVVWKAWQARLERTVALKMISPDAHLNPEARERFVREARAVARLKHPNIVQIHEIGEGRAGDAGSPVSYFSLEFVNGGSLARNLAGSPLPPREAARLVETLARAVHVAHEHSIIHRDLKPANILLQIPEPELRSAAKAGPTAQVETPRPEFRDSAESTVRKVQSAIPKITDFGLAKWLDDDSGQTRTGAIMGTPSYMAPEQAAGRTHDIGPATDVYALGAILYEMLTGRPPFRGTSVGETLEQVRSREPVPPRQLQPKVPRDLETIGLKCLEKESQKRYESAAALAEDLRRFIAGEPVKARPAKFMERGVKWMKRRPALAGLLGLSALTALVLVAFVVGLVYNGWLQEALQETEKQKGLAEEQHGEAVKQRTRAEEEALRARRFQYAADMHLAQTAMNEARVGQTVELLERHRPKRTADSDLRGFEWYYLWNLCHSGRLTLRHNGPVTCLAYSPDGQRLGTGSEDGAVTIWDATSGVRQAGPMTHSGRVEALAFSSDGRMLASAATDGKLKLWALSTGTEISSVPADVQTVSFSPDGKRLAAVTRDGVAVLLWETPKGPVDKIDLADRMKGDEIKKFSHETVATAFSPDGKLLAIGRRRRSIGREDLQPIREAETKIGVYELASGRLVLSLSLERDHLVALAIHPDGRHLAGAVGLADGPDEMPPSEIRVWQLANGKEIAKSARVLEGLGAIAYCPDGKQLASSAAGLSAREARFVRSFFGYTPDPPGSITLWDGSLSQPVHVLGGHIGVVSGLAFSPDGKQLACSSLSGVVKVWDADGRSFIRPQVRPEYPVHAVLSTNFRYFAEEQRGLPRENIPPAPPPMIKVAPNKEARSRSDREQLLLPMSDNYKFWGRVSVPNDLLPIAWQPRADEVPPPRPWQPLEPARLMIWDTARNQVLQALPSATSLEFSPDGERLAAAHFEGVTLWETQSGNEILTIPVGEEIKGMRFSPQGTILAAGVRGKAAAAPPKAGADRRPQRDGKLLPHEGAVYLWDASTGQKLHMLALRVGGPRSLDFSPDGALLAAGTDDRRIRVWDVRSGRELMSLAGHTQPIVCLTFSPDGKKLASTSASSPPLNTDLVEILREVFESSPSGEIKVWDLSTAVEIRTLQTRYFRDAWLAFSPDSSRLAAGTSDGQATFWDMQSGQQTATLPFSALSADWKRAALTGDNYLLRIVGTGWPGGREVPRHEPHAQPELLVPAPELLPLPRIRLPPAPKNEA